MEHLETIAHILRRTSFGPGPGVVESLADLDVDAVIDRALTTTDDRGAGSAPDLDDNGDAQLIGWWTDRLRDPDAGLHERMAWYWHGHFTTSLAEVSASMMWAQHQLVRSQALGNFRELARAMVHDAGLLVYLDADGSDGANPNENLARELMELFTLGVGNYTEDDVKAAARGLSGYRVDWDTAEVGFEEEAHYGRPVRFLGRRARFEADDVVDALCDRRACAHHVARRLHRHLVGLEPDADHLDSLAAVFRSADLEILPLVEAILRSDQFLTARRARPRQPIEWLVAALAALGATDVELDPWGLESGGQVPFHPPNVAGWPDDDRWTAGNQVLHRVNRVLDLSWEQMIDIDVVPEVDAVLTRCGIFEASDTTRRTLVAATRDQSEYEEGLELLFALTLVSPEFALA